MKKNLFFTFFLFFSQTLLCGVFCGPSTSFIIHETGKLFSFGDNEKYQLGLGHNNFVNIPTQVQGVENIISVAGGFDHTLMLDSSGQVWATGSNKEGQLGLGCEQKYATKPIIIESLKDKFIKSIAANSYVSFAIDDDGNVWSFGSNKYFRLGHYELISQYFKPKKIEGLNNIISLAIGKNHSLALDTFGQVWGFGNNKYWQIGNVAAFRKIPELSNIKYIAAGVHNSFAVDIEGNIWSFGRNDVGQLGWKNGDNGSLIKKIPTLQHVKSVVAGNMHTIVLLENGSVFSFGDRPLGGLGNENFYSFEPQQIDKLPNIIDAAAGYHHTLLVDVEGNIFVFGMGDDGKLGVIGIDEEISYPVLMPNIKAKTRNVSVKGARAFEQRK